MAGLLILDQTYLSLDRDLAGNAAININYYQKRNLPAKCHLPVNYPFSGVLKKKADYLECIGSLKKAGLPRHNDGPKNWDTLAFLSIILKDPTISPDSAILDAGGEHFSAILHQLAVLGYRNLYCINLVFTKESSIGPINYLPGDVCKTSFGDNSFQAIICQSVIEHGVDLDRYLSEMSRILQPGGLLMTSTDYWVDPIDTHGKTAYGTPVRIFNKNEIAEIIKKAANHDLQWLEPCDLSCGDRVIQWKDLNYTFIYFTFRKMSGHSRESGS
jgi:SAM-dependent methyltransferase